MSGKTSVVICAYTEERWDDIQAAVASVRAQTRRPYEIILVIDHNPDLFRRLREAHSDLVVVENTGPRGLSGGKNTGVATAGGAVVAFLDDDAVAEPDWLAHLEDGYDAPGIVGVGGRTLPMWAGDRPRWFPDEFAWTVGCSYRGMPDRRTPIRNLMGGNASFLREVFEEAGGFKSGIGRAHGIKLPLGCEETEFCIRVSQRIPGSSMIFEPRAVIGHRVPAARSRFSYFRSRCYAEGLSKALVTDSVGTSDGLASERTHALQTLPAGMGYGLRDAARGDVSGLGRAAAIATGLALAAGGYAAGRARLLLGRDARREVAYVEQGAGRT